MTKSNTSTIEGPRGIRVSVSNEELWGFDNPQSRERFTTPPKGQTELTSVRLYSSNLRVLDEIIHSGIDPRLKTKSDCIQDAVALFIRDWVENYSDGLSGRTLQVLKMEAIRSVRESRDRFLQLTDEEIDLASRIKDRDALTTLLIGLKTELAESQVYAPKTYLDELQIRIDRLEEMLRRDVVL
jgi:hypothetical protein